MESRALFGLNKLMIFAASAHLSIPPPGSFFNICCATDGEATAPGNHCQVLFPEEDAGTGTIKLLDRTRVSPGH